MNDERTRILSMLAGGKITAEEAEGLLDALQGGPRHEPDAPAAEPAAGPRKNPKFMYVKIAAVNGDNVDVKVPLSLARAGLRLTSLIPPQAMDQINRSMEERGVSMDFANFKSGDIDELIEGLTEMEINVDSHNGDNVRVFCA